jgi:uncharacterized protein YcbX
MYTLSQLSIYPIKSLGGISLTEARVEIRGFQYDRRWMLVNEAGRFMSQREIPAMALLRTAIEGAHLLVYHKDTPSEPLRIPLEVPVEELVSLETEVWGDFFTSALMPREISDWFADMLHENVRLVLMPESTRRWADSRYAPEGQHVSFADGFPYLLIGQASLDDLNSRMDAPLPMNRFRPNMVFTGGLPFEEDNWRHFQVGDVAFCGVKPCARCSIPTTDQETAMRAAEPLKTLATYRNLDNKILFGQNVIWMGEGETVVRLGDGLRLIVERDA